MRVLGQNGRWAAVAAVVLVFLIAGMFGTLQLLRERDLLISAYRRGSWTAVQAETQFLKLYQAAVVHWAEPTLVAAEDVQLQLDLFWSRLPIILESDEGADLRRIEGVVPAITALQDQLPELEAEIHALDRARPETFEALHRRLEEFRDPLHNATLGSLHHDAATFNQHRLYQNNQQVLAVSLVSIAAGCVLIVMLLWQLYRARSLVRQAQGAEARAEVAHAQLHDAIESTSEGFLLLDADERVVLANSRYAEFYPKAAGLLRPGVPFASVLANSAPGRGDDPPQDWLRERLDRLRDPGSWEQTLDDGRICLVSERRTASGGVVSVHSDVSALKRAESMLQERIAAMDAATEGIAIVRPDGTYSYLNGAHLELYGYERVEDLLGASWQLLYDDAERERLHREAWATVEERGVWLGEAVGRRRDGTLFPQELSLTRLSNGGAIWVVHDITNRKAAEADHAQLLQQFHLAQKAEALGRLAGGIAHDFNNILAAILGNAEFLIEDLPEAAPEREYAQQIQAAGRRAKDLVQQILAFSRRQPVRRTTIDVVAVLQESEKLLRSTLPKSLTFVARTTVPECLIRGDATQISQVLMNLCINAADALDGEAGTVEVELDLVDVDGGCAEGLEQLRSAGSQPVPVRIAPGPRPGSERMWVGVLNGRGRYVRIAVTDTGSGVPTAILSRIFDPFFTTKPVGKGTGLGLAAAQGIVALHDGAMTIDTCPGAGTRFEILLPTAAEDASERQPSAVVRPTGRGQRVLVVDDEPAVARVLQGMLERLGYRTEACGGGEAALAAVERLGTAWAAVITDQMMPGMTGSELAAWIGGRWPDLPVVICTGYGGTIGDAAGRPVIAKPVDLVELATVLDRVVGPAAADGMTGLVPA